MFRMVIHKKFKKQSSKIQAQVFFIKGRVFNEREKDAGLMNEYERLLERDYLEVKKKYVEAYRPIKIDIEDLLEPSEDLRFKRHNVLPFNIRQ